MMNFLSKCWPNSQSKKSGNRPDVSVVKRHVDAQIGRAVTRLSDR